MYLSLQTGNCQAHCSILKNKFPKQLTDFLWNLVPRWGFHGLCPGLQKHASVKLHEKMHTGDCFKVLYKEMRFWVVCFFSSPHVSQCTTNNISILVISSGNKKKNSKVFVWYCSLELLLLICGHMHRLKHPHPHINRIRSFPGDPNVQKSIRLWLAIYWR